VFDVAANLLLVELNGPFVDIVAKSLSDKLTFQLIKNVKPK
jgi:hypothetical protein